MALKYIPAQDPEVAAAIDAELARQRGTIELIASENFVSLAVLEAAGTRAHQQVRRGTSRQALLRRLREGRHRREPRARPRRCELFGADHANVQPHAGAQANLAVYYAALDPGDTVLGMNLAHGRSPDARLAGQLLGQVVQRRAVRPGHGDRDDRLRRDGASRQGAPAQDDHRRRVGVSAHHRLRALRRRRQGGRRGAHGRHGAHRRARRDGRAPLAGAVRRLRDVDLAQDAARPALGLRAVQGGVGGQARQGRLPGPAGRPARAHHRRQGGRVRRGDASPSSRPTSTRSSSTPRRWARRWSSAVCA